MREMEERSWAPWNESVRDRRRKKVGFNYVLIYEDITHQNMHRGQKLIILII